MIALYLIVFGLVCFHEMDRIAGWFENICLEWDASPRVLEFCNQTKNLGDQIGVTQLVAEEKTIINLGHQFSEIGEIKDKTLSASIPPHPEPAASSRTTQVYAMKTNPDSIAPSAVPGAEPASGPAGNGAEAPGPVAGVRPAETVGANWYDASATGNHQTAPPPVQIGTPGHNQRQDTPPQTAGESTESGPTPPGIEPPGEENLAEVPKPDSQASEADKIKPRKILIAGDSMILEGFGVALERKLKKYEGLEIIREGKYSSGLSRPDYYDWNASLKEKLEKHHPDLLIVSLGANDPQDILDQNKKRHYVATEGWNKIYSERALHFLQIAQGMGVPTIWVGLPIMGHKKYGQRIANINTLVAEQCSQVPNCHFVDVWLTLADDKENYTTFITSKKGRHIRIRAKDKVHLTEAGGEIMVKDFLKQARGYIDLPEKHIQQADSRSLLKSPAAKSAAN